MTNREIIDAVQSLIPAAEITVYGGDLSTLVFHDPKVKRPTDAEIIAEIERLKTA